MIRIKNPVIAEIFSNYPDEVHKKMIVLRQLILDTANDMEEVDTVEETLRWGEPSYLTRKGSTIRISPVKSNPTEQYAIYFNCNTTLVETFRELYTDQFTFSGNRALIFDVNDQLPVNELKHCVFLALSYHLRKHLPLLGA
ncbi:MAG: DUF1801 domain-containing protein [Proteobacteria bacterium]|nr:DUF1801 domain-containing protein [Pseudomonadota bacterium]